MDKEKKKINFESALKDLEKIAEKLEEGNLSLDDSIKEFERGIILAKFCHEKLDEAERKIEILQKGEQGEIKAAKVKVKKDIAEIEDDEELQGSLL